MITPHVLGIMLRAHEDLLAEVLHNNTKALRKSENEHTKTAAEGEALLDRSRADIIQAAFNMGTKPITMDAFFALPEVRSYQEMQKSSYPSWSVHREATAAIVAIAKRYGVEQFFEQEAS